MNNRQIFAISCFGLSIILSLGFGWNWFLGFNDCNIVRNTINRSLENQDDLLFTYGFFADHSLSVDQKQSLQKYIDLREPIARSDIEYFKKQCRSKTRQNQLIAMLKGYEIYLYTKQGIFKESQASGFQWIRDTFPYDPVYSNIE